MLYVTETRGKTWDIVMGLSYRFLISRHEGIKYTINKNGSCKLAAKGHVNVIPKQKLAFILSHCHIQEGMADGRQTFDILKNYQSKAHSFLHNILQK